jgi:chromosome segregation ATPase
MTFEERLERIAERHEALAQSLELLHADVRELSQAVKQHEGRLARHEDFLVQIMEATARLVHTAELHEQRLERLEEGKQP